MRQAKIMKFAILPLDVVQPHCSQRLTLQFANSQKNSSGHLLQFPTQKRNKSPDLVIKRLRMEDGARSMWDQNGCAWPAAVRSNHFCLASFPVEQQYSLLRVVRQGIFCTMEEKVSAALLCHASVCTHGKEIGFMNQLPFQ